MATSNIGVRQAVQSSSGQADRGCGSPALAADATARRGGDRRTPPPSNTMALLWPREELMTVPNGLSLLRAAMGPAVAYSACCSQYEIAAAGVVAAGVSDFLDGAIARAHPSQKSVLGSFLDPLADKIFLSVSTMALGCTGALPLISSVTLVASHGTLVAGAFYQRATELGWEWNGAREFFMVRRHGVIASKIYQNGRHAADWEAGVSEETASSRMSGSKPADNLSPLLIGKALTVLQYLLLGVACIGSMGVDQYTTVVAAAGESDQNAAALPSSALGDGGPSAAIRVSSYVLALTSVAIIPAYVRQSRNKILAASSPASACSRYRTHSARP